MGFQSFGIRTLLDSTLFLVGTPMTFLLVFICVVGAISTLVCSYYMRSPERIKLLLHSYLGVEQSRIPRLSSELNRKMFHLIGMVIPIIYYTGLRTQLLNHFRATLLLLLHVIAYFGGETLRLYSAGFDKGVDSVIGGIMRPDEKQTKYFGSFFSDGGGIMVSGMGFYITGNWLAVMFFSAPIALAASMYLIVGDLTAALVGIGFGNVAIVGKKTIEGTATMFVSCFALGFFCFYKVGLWEYPALVGAVAATIVELLSGMPPFRYVNDNLSIPVLSGLALTIAQYRLGEPFELA